MKKFSLITTDTVNDLVSHTGDLCLSIYQTTHRKFPENKQDPIRFRNLVNKLEATLIEKYPADQVEKVLQDFRNLENDKEIWNFTWEGLAVLAAPGIFKIFRLPIPVVEVSLVDDTFFTKPLRQVLQSNVRYQVLGVSRKSVRLFEGNGRSLHEIELAKEVPKNQEEALGAELTKPHTTVASYGGTGVGSQPMHHGHGGKGPQIEIDDERFFRALDNAVCKFHSLPSKLPLIIAALPEHHHLFAKVSENKFLLSGKIAHHPDSITNEELEIQAWKIFEPKLNSEISELNEKFNFAQSKNLGSDNLEEVVKAVYDGRVQTLLVAADCKASGHLDRATGRISASKLSGPEKSDLLDDLSEFATLKGASVVVIPQKQLSTDSGIAAIYRF